METQDYRTSWEAYQEAVASLYERPVETMAESVQGDVVRAPEVDERAEVVVDRSERLGEAAARGLESPDPGERELAELRLLASATLDLSVANDLARKADDGILEGTTEQVSERGPTFPTTVSELRAVLDARSDTDLLKSTEEEAWVLEGVARADDPRAAKQALRQAANRALTDIRDDAANGGQVAFVSLMATPQLPIAQAAGVVGKELMAMMDESVARFLRWAARLVVQAIDKILKLLGKDAQDAARKKAAGWIGDLQKGTLFETLLDKLYELEAIRADTDRQIDAAPEDLGVDPFDAAETRVTGLAAKYRKQKQVITLLVRGLALASAWILAIQPWGPLALATAYVAAIGYVVYAGGDYVDWFRTGTSERLDFVPGVRTAVRESLSR